MAKIFHVSRSGYYAWMVRKPCRHVEKDAILAKKIEKIFKDHYGRYGSPRVCEELKALGFHVSRKRVERLMKENNLRARWKRKRVKTTDSSHKYPVADNILNRDFHAEEGGMKYEQERQLLG